MRPLLLILNPRAISECVESFRALDIEKAWLTAYSEPQLVDEVATLIDATDYTHYVMASDDLIVSPLALYEVLQAAKTNPVTTGYCNFDLTDDPRVGLTKGPLLERRPSPTSYGEWWTQTEVDAYPSDLIPTSFTGWVLTCMPRELWLRYPFQISELGAQSDYALSWRLQQDGVPIVAPKHARTFHVKELHGGGDQERRKRLLIGEVPASVTLEVRG
jgi:hypothetical protein